MEIKRVMRKPGIYVCGKLFCNNQEVIERQNNNKELCRRQSGNKLRKIRNSFVYLKIPQRKCYFHHVTGI